MSPAQRLAIADVALALHVSWPRDILFFSGVEIKDQSQATVKEICKGHDFTNEPMAVNKIHGVNRESYFVSGMVHVRGEGGGRLLRLVASQNFCSGFRRHL